ncbi:efflux RND transporter permease subunit [Variovorax guangxiensis]|uniref:Efflux RND transporter permease subunit n=1 Tax=Variovorax guangxiensis TaxID=1775474 RepID=A0A3S0XK45_9BURK|nr:efflux RND transporter permease subunit [Variovorax guangxiensis]RUR71255.1 efflux RND transporter permease subunit [Variovorax guangxiensis]
MFGISQYALKRPRFTLLAAMGLVLAGLWLALDFPSTEEPQVTVRTATVMSVMPGATVERMEQLVARPTEESVLGMPEVRRVKTTVRSGFAFTYVELHPTVSPDKLPGVWQRLRLRMADLHSSLPEGTSGPMVDDEFGRVAVLTMGLAGPGYTAGEVREHARRLRDALYGLAGVERVSLHGIRDEQVQIILDIPALAVKGLTPSAISKAVATRNVIASAGFLEVGGAEMSLNVTGDAQNPAQLRTTPVPLPGGGTVPLGEIARVERVTQDPPMSGAFVNGTPAAVIAISMDPGLNVVSFADRLRDRVHELEAGLPAGMTLVPITDQAQIVTKQLKQVGQVFVETTMIVMGVVVLFLGWRTGLIVGAIVPTTVLGTLAIMRLLSIDLHIISVGAIIIALGLFVDNAIVVAEDMERRLSLGETREHAAAKAGHSMLVPLLVSSLAIILTFLPLVLSSTEMGEYLRSMGIVMAIALMLSLMLAVTVTPLLSQRFAQHHAELSRTARAVEALTGWYRVRVRWVLRHRALYVSTMVLLLCGAGWLFGQIPSELMPASERRQLQMSIELAPGTSTAHTLDKVAAVSKTLADRAAFPELASHAVYVGDGGPRFILALNPPTPAANRAYAVLTMSPGMTHAAVIERVRSGLSERFPDVRFEPKRFSMGASDAGLAVFRLTSTDGQSHRQAAEKLAAALQTDARMRDVQTDAERMVMQLDVQVNQAKAHAAGVSTADIARSLDMLLAGTAIGRYREGDTVLPVILRGDGALRAQIDQLTTLPIQKADGQGSVPLGQVAVLALKPQPSVIQRYNQERAITVSARHVALTAQGIADQVAPVLQEIRGGGTVQIALGGEIEENIDANAAIAQLLPACMIAMFLLFVWQFESVRKSLIVMASIPFVAIGAALALALTGTTLTFVGTLGLLALAGIIVNNAVLLIDAIEEAGSSGMPAAEAIEEAASKRLRPIVMTKLVCILGLVPLWLFGGAIWTSLSIVMMGGLALGTLITLGLIPALYAIAYRVQAPAA